MSPARKRVSPGLARVRKAIPPPGKIFGDKNKDIRKRSKEELKRALEEDSLACKSS